MTPQIRNYDFSDLVDDCQDIIDSDGRKGLNNLKKDLNKFFKGSTCSEIIFTRSDQMFFGMCTYPITNEEICTAILQDDKKVRFTEYKIEIDSKLLHPSLMITPQEMLAILLHEIGHIINDPSPVEELRKAMAVQLIKSGQSLNIPKSAQYYAIISYGIKDTIRRMNSMFFIYKNGEVLADEFVYMCGFDQELNSIFTKLCKSGMKVNSDTANKLTSLAWTLSIYKGIKLKRIPALKTITKIRSLSGSYYEKKEMEIIENAIKTIDDTNIEESYLDINNIQHYYVFTEDKKEIKRSKYAELKKNHTISNIRKFEQDVFEYKMRIRHIADQDDAYYLMRMINLRISVLEDYLEHERLGESERKRWWDLLEKYYSLREELANVSTYRYDYSQSLITVNYPEIKPNRM